jgi:hypothetical protein
MSGSLKLRFRGVNRVRMSATRVGFAGRSSCRPVLKSTTVLDRFLDPVTACLTPAVAENIVGVRVDAQTQSRLDELAEKANLGELSEGDREEYAQYVEGMDLVGILKAKDRQVLKRRVG